MEPVAKPLPSPGFGLRDPWLLPLAPDAALLLARSVQLESPGPAPNSVDTLPLKPWGAWPPAFPAPKHAHPVANPVPFAAGMEPSGTLALAVQPFPMNAPVGCPVHALYGISPDMPQWPPGLLVPVQGGCGDTPLAVATAGDGTHFVAADLTVIVGGLGERGLIFALFDEAGQVLTPPFPLCASTPHTGDVLAGAHDFLFAHSASLDGSCGAAGASSRLQLQRLSPTGIGVTTVHQGTDELVLTRLLPRSKGAWLIFQESGASALVMPPAMALPLSADDLPGAPFAITPEGLGQVAVAALGDGFAVAVVDAIDPSAPTIRLRVFSVEGMLEAETSFSTSGAWLLNDRLTLLGSPDGTSLLVGWAGMTPGEGSSIFLRRFDCVKPD